MTREDVAKAYIQSAHARAGRAGVIAFGVGIALVVVWSAELSDRSGALLGALAEKPTQLSLLRERRELLRKRSDLVKKLARLPAGSRSSQRSNEREAYTKILEAEASALQKLDAAISTRRINASTVTFKLPGLPDITVRDSASSLVWLGCAVGLLLYLIWCRRLVLALYSRALRILSAELEVSPPTLYDIAGPLPFWVAPLPRGDGRYVSVALLRSAAGWDRNGGRNYVAIAVTQLAALALVLHVVYLGTLFSQLNVDDQSRAFLTRNTLVLPLTIVVGLTFAGIAFWWLAPGRVPDRHSFEAPERYAGLTRRRLLVSGVGLLSAAVLSLLFVPPAALRRSLLRPRFRRWTNRAKVAAGIYEVGRARRVIYARGDGRPRVLKSVPDAVIRSVEPREDQLLRIDPASLSAWIDAASQRLKLPPPVLAEKGIAQAMAMGQAGNAPPLLWYEFEAARGRTARSRPDLDAVIAAIDALGETPGGAKIENAIRSRRDRWSGWAAKLAPAATSAPRRG